MGAVETSSENNIYVSHFILAVFMSAVLQQYTIYSKQGYNNSIFELVFKSFVLTLFVTFRLVFIVLFASLYNIFNLVSAATKYLKFHYSCNFFVYVNQKGAKTEVVLQK